MTMDVSYVARNVSLPDRFRDYAQEKFSKIEQLSQRAQRLEIKVTKQANHRHSDGNLTVELTVQGKGKVIRAEAQADDKFAAFDLAFGKLLERLRRLRDRQKDRLHQRVSVADATAALPVIDPGRSLVDQVVEEQAAQDGVTAESDGQAPVKIRKKVFPARPVSVHDAVDAMEMVGHDFYLFIDEDTGQPSAVYRRKGWSYGVITLDAEHPDAEPQEEEIGYRAATV
ncbi:ribosome-associated translation inhibitor RaiA [Citricoccus sp. SGAir0253]|uniref:ribosome hibernation-promoting factor, HPF/YfiA family n=1 Tax=Citricoccus sp. SGAir0253 TaxID=2567881 RepID=UPI0010CD3F3C|nr:ribosome-associated translation inhibitor RaiA [Citricoccus sp. SGAir0253]QCU77750.1 ribosome-associated translation inhibitor RaiA [Citricoccus sp. SGAir0253]